MITVNKREAMVSYGITKDPKTLNFSLVTTFCRCVAA